MQKIIGNQMKKIIEKVLIAHGLKDRFDTNTDCGVRIELPGYLPLIIEKHGNSMIVAHYRRQNGDSIPDPDMEFLVTDIGWVPAGLQNCFGHYSRASMVDGEGRIRIDKKALRSQLTFSNMWARNILAQGFAVSGKASVQWT